MRIGIDIQPLKRDFFRGINISAQCLIDAMLEKDCDGENTYVLFNSKGVSSDFFRNFWNRSIKLVEGGITPRLSASLDIFHELNFFDLMKKQISPSRLKCRTVATVYDIIPALFWDHYLINKPKRVREDYILRLDEIDAFDRIIVPSLSTKNDLME